MFALLLIVLVVFLFAMRPSLCHCQSFRQSRGLGALASNYVKNKILDLWPQIIYKSPQPCS
jgi:hypothetical protein